MESKKIKKIHNHLQASKQQEYKQEQEGFLMCFHGIMTTFLSCADKTMEKHFYIKYKIYFKHFFFKRQSIYKTFTLTNV